MLLTPHEFVADGGEEVLGVEADEVDGEGSTTERDFDRAREGEASRVHAEGDGFLNGLLHSVMYDWDRNQTQTCIVGDDDGTQGKGVGANGSDDEAAAVGSEDGASAGEGVGGGTRGRGHNDAVAGIGGHVEVVDINLGSEHRRVFGTVEKYLVESIGATGVEGVALHLEEGAAFGGETARQKVGNKRGEVFLASGGEEAQVAEINTQDGGEGLGARSVDKLHGGEQGAVATDGEEVVVAIDAVSVVDGLCNNARALQFGAEMVESRKVGGIDVAVIEGYLHGFAILLLTLCR